MNNNIKQDRERKKEISNLHNKKIRIHGSNAECHEKNIFGTNILQRLKTNLLFCKNIFCKCAYSMSLLNQIQLEI